MLWLLTARKNANYPNKEKERGEEFTGRVASISPQTTSESPLVEITWI